MNVNLELNLTEEQKKKIAEIIKSGNFTIAWPPQDDLSPEDYETVCVGENIWTLFHRVWGQAKDSPSYDKELFLKFEKKISLMQRKLIK